MKIYKGDMFEESKADVIACTSNRVLTKDNHLVMGAGAALQMQKIFTNAPAYFGNKIFTNFDISRNYYFLLGPRLHNLSFKPAIFQTKEHYEQKSKISLITLSLLAMAEYCNRYPDIIVAVNMPGVGLGGLNKSVIIPLVEEVLGDVPNSQIWEL